MNEYTVKSGDTLGKIALEFYGNSSKYTEIAKANNIDNPNNIQVGQKLLIPNLNGNDGEGGGTSFKDTAVRISINENHQPQPAITRDDDETNELITAAQLKQIVPHVRVENVAKYIAHLNAKMQKASINTINRIAHFIAQLAHESASFNRIEESLYYSSAERLQAVFGRRKFPTLVSAEPYVKNPEAAANFLYANKIGNGDEASGDGWKYRGRGLIQLTGRANYQECSDDIDIDLVSNPNWVAEQPEIAVTVATWYWTYRRINEVANEDDVKAVTRNINPALVGLNERKEFFERGMSVLQGLSA